MFRWYSAEAALLALVPASDRFSFVWHWSTDLPAGCLHPTAGVALAESMAEAGGLVGRPFNHHLRRRLELASASVERHAIEHYALLATLWDQAGMTLERWTRSARWILGSSAIQAVEAAWGSRKLDVDDLRTLSHIERGPLNGFLLADALARRRYRAITVVAGGTGYAVPARMTFSRDLEGSVTITGISADQAFRSAAARALRAAKVTWRRTHQRWPENLHDTVAACSVNLDFTLAQHVMKCVAYENIPISGGSVGLAVALSAYAHFLDERLDGSILATGEVDENGRVYWSNEVAIEDAVTKAQASSAYNVYRRMILPASSRRRTGATRGMHQVYVEDLNQALKLCFRMPFDETRELRRRPADEAVREGLSTNDGTARAASGGHRASLPRQTKGAEGTRITIRINEGRKSIIRDGYLWRLLLEELSATEEETQAFHRAFSHDEKAEVLARVLMKEGTSWDLRRRCGPITLCLDLDKPDDRKSDPAARPYDPAPILRALELRTHESIREGTHPRLVLSWRSAKTGRIPEAGSARDPGFGDAADELAFRLSLLRSPFNVAAAHALSVPRRGDVLPPIEDVNRAIQHLLTQEILRINADGKFEFSEAAHTAARARRMASGNHPGLRPILHASNMRAAAYFVPFLVPFLKFPGLPSVLRADALHARHLLEALYHLQEAEDYSPQEDVEGRSSIRQAREFLCYCCLGDCPDSAWRIEHMPVQAADVLEGWWESSRVAPHPTWLADAAVWHARYLRDFAHADEYLARAQEALPRVAAAYRDWSQALLQQRGDWVDIHRLRGDDTRKVELRGLIERIRHGLHAAKPPGDMIMDAIEAAIDAGGRAMPFEMAQWSVKNRPRHLQPYAAAVGLCDLVDKPLEGERIERLFRDLDVRDKEGVLRRELRNRERAREGDSGESVSLRVFRQGVEALVRSHRNSGRHHREHR